ncbi:MAG: MerC domain-containing protein [Gemmatimonadota bacterium]
MITRYWYRLAGIAPLVCAIHCIAMPAVVALAPALAPSAAVETWLLVASAGLGIGGLAAGTRRHRRAIVWAPAGAGFGLWITRSALAPDGLAETLVTVAGALLVAGALAWSARLRHLAACRHCGCPSWGRSESRADIRAAP